MTPEEWERRLRWSATGHGWFARTDKVRIFVSWKVVADAVAQGHLLLDLEQVHPLSHASSGPAPT